MKICFFTTTSFELVKNESYTYNDFIFLQESYNEVVFASNIKEIPWDCDLYFSWWLSGSFYPLIVSICVKKPIIVIAGGNEAQIVYDSFYNKHYGYKNSSFLKKVATHIVSRFATKIISVSHHLQIGYESLFKRKCLMIYNGVDLNQFKLQTESCEKKYITFISSTDKSMAELKRLEIFLKAISLLSIEIRSLVLILGKVGNNHEYYIKLIREYGLNDFVIFGGHINSELMPIIFHQSKVFVQISEVETFGLAVAEALACGTPVVISNNGALSEVAGEYGTYVNHNSPVSVADGISKVLNTTKSEDFKEKMARNVHIATKFSLMQRKNELKSIINELI